MITINYCIVFHTNNCKPALTPPCIHFHTHVHATHTLHMHSHSCIHARVYVCPDARAHILSQCAYKEHNFAHTCMDLYSHQNTIDHMCIHSHTVCMGPCAPSLTCTNMHTLHVEHWSSHPCTQAPRDEWSVAVVGLMQAQTPINIYMKHSSS